MDDYSFNLLNRLSDDALWKLIQEASSFENVAYILYKPELATKFKHVFITMYPFSWYWIKDSMTKQEIINHERTILGMREGKPF